MADLEGFGAGGGGCWFVGDKEAGDRKQERREPMTKEDWKKPRAELKLGLSGLSVCSGRSAVRTKQGAGSQFFWKDDGMIHRHNSLDFHALKMLEKLSHL